MWIWARSEQALEAADEVLVRPLDTPKGVVWPNPYLPPAVERTLVALGVGDLKARFQAEVKTATHPLLLPDEPAS